MASKKRVTCGNCGDQFDRTGSDPKSCPFCCISGPFLSRRTTLEFEADTIEKAATAGLVIFIALLVVMFATFVAACGAGAYWLWSLAL